MNWTMAQLPGENENQSTGNTASARRPIARSYEESTMKNLKGTKTHDNLKAAFAGESQANRRYLYFASKADVEG